MRRARWMLSILAAACVLAVLPASPAGATPTDGNPFGHLDLVRRVPEGLRVAGWAIDPDTAAPIAVHLYAAGAAHGTSANRSRPDVGARYPAYGSNHGFDLTIPIGPGGVRVCAYGINVGRGTHNPLIGCHTVVVSNLPFGHIDLVRRAPGGVEVAGWVIDPDTAASTHVHAYVDRAAVSAIAATGPRPDVARVHPGYGAAHGFRAVVPAATGRASTICLYGINVGPGSVNPVLGCASVNLDGNPFGHLDFGQGVGSDTMVVGGWVIDPDVADPTHIHVYVDGVAFGAFGAGGDRPDVGRAYPGYGSAHGFRVEVRARRDQHVCVYAINVRGPGHNDLLGCRIDPTTGRPPPPGAPAPRFTSATRPAIPADVGQAWRPGCPVGLDRLSHVTVGYWGFDGGAESGALVVHHDWVGPTIAVFRRLYDIRFQIHRIEPVTEYSGPGDERPDHENITSAFICRPVTGGTDWSQHSYGWAIDINPVQNPYVNGATIVPDPEARDYLDRTQPAPAMVHAGDAVVPAFAAIGWEWGGNWRSLRDYMHFSATGR